MTACTVRNIPLDKLVLSPTNVHKTPATAAEDAELEASIRSKGILQNLVVHAADGGLYEVDAGGRRLKILQKLAAEGAIGADTKVPCKIEQAEDAVETSLMENTIRAAMHPADECAAMAAHIDAGAAIEDVATRFGVSENHVKQRLRLGKLAPELLDAFRAGDIGLELVTTFTLGADHAAQLAVWRRVKARSYVSPYSVRRMLTQSAVALHSRLGLFVGPTAYEAAGGTIARDLFSGDEDGFMNDAALVQRLAIEKLEAKAEELRPQWAWTRAILVPNTASWRNTLAFSRSRANCRPSSPKNATASSSASRRSRSSWARMNGTRSSPPKRRGSRSAAPKLRRSKKNSPSIRKGTASAPAASSRSAKTANSACIRA
jgi:ParB family transcriptional regulator, chromosome partitioning protein